MAMNRIACELVRSGGLGKVMEVLARELPGLPKTRPPTPFPEATVPAGLDWDVWLNQAAWRPFNGQWMGWMRWRDFAGGEMTNWGAHGVDQIQWALGMDGTGPVEMWPLTPGHNGQVEMRYANGVPVRFVLEHGPDGRRRSSSAKRASWRSTATSSPPTRRRSPPNCSRRSTRRKRRGSGATRRPSGRPAGTCRTGSIASARGSGPWPTSRSAIARSASATWRTSPAGVGRRLKWDPAKEQFVGDDEANRLVDRPRRKGYELGHIPKSRLTRLRSAIIVGRGGANRLRQPLGNRRQEVVMKTINVDNIPEPIVRDGGRGSDITTAVPRC